MRISRHILAAVAAMALMLMAPTLVSGPLAVDSAIYNYTWTRQFGDALAHGVLYPRWLPGSFSGFGNPTFYFYPPIAFYLSGLLQDAGLATLPAIGGAALLALFASGVSMAAWLRFKGANPLWALLYMAAPYHLTDWYERAALAEFTAFVWLPLIALGIEAQPRRWATPLLACAYAGLVMTHLPMAVLASVGLIAPMVAARPERLVPCALAGALGLGLSAIYLLPALTLQDQVSIATMWRPYFQPSAWTLWGPQHPLWLAPLALAPTVLALGRPRFWSGLTLVLAAMSLALVPAIWTLPVLAHVQFPWRLLAIVEFAAVTAAATARPRPWVLALAFAIALLAWGRLAGVEIAACGLSYPADMVRRLPDAVEYLPAGSHITGAGPNYAPDRAQLAPPTLAHQPVPQATWGAWISLVAMALLVTLGVRSWVGQTRPQRRPV
jgi:hypothetical protein